jgi:hypothetical protein
MRLAILYNLREKSGPKIKYGQSYTNICARNSPFWLQDPVVHLPCSTFFSRQKRTHHARHSPDGQRGLSSVYILVFIYNTTSDNARNTLLYLAVIPGNHRYSLGIGIPYVKYIAHEFQL